MQVDDLSVAGGWSVFAVDPGETTGWSWSCVARKEANVSMDKAIRASVERRTGFMLGDVAHDRGQIEVNYSGTVERIGFDEWQQAERLIAALEVCGQMGSSVSKGAVPQITDVVIEDFVLRERTMTRDLLSPVRVTAAFQVLLCQHEWRMRIHLQSASEKAVITDEILKSLRLYAKGQRHANDASRHLALWLRKNR